MSGVRRPAHEPEGHEQEGLGPLLVQVALHVGDADLPDVGPREREQVPGELVAPQHAEQLGEVRGPAAQVGRRSRRRRAPEDVGVRAEAEHDTEGGGAEHAAAQDGRGRRPAARTAPPREGQHDHQVVAEGQPGEEDGGGQVQAPRGRAASAAAAPGGRPARGRGGRTTSATTAALQSVTVKPKVSATPAATRRRHPTVDEHGHEQGAGGGGAQGGEEVDPQGHAAERDEADDGGVEQRVDRVAGVVRRPRTRPTYWNLAVSPLNPVPASSVSR